MWIDALHGHGTEVELTDGARTLMLRHGETVVSWTVRRLRRTPRPSEVGAVPADQMLWLPAMTVALRERLAELGVSWVADPGEVHLDTPWGLIAHGPPRQAVPETGKSAGPHLSPGARRSLQFLLERADPSTQQRIATAVGLSQPRLSQVLKELRGHQLAQRVPGGWHAPRPDRAFDAWLSADDSPVALTTRWHSVAPPRDQLTAVRERADLEQAKVRLCGDWAADLLAPWRQPRLITVHVDRTIDLESVGFVPSPADSATVAVHVGPTLPDWQPDPAVVAVMTAERHTWPLAPITEIAREIVATGGSDADQAVDVLKTRWLRARERAA